MAQQSQPVSDHYLTQAGLALALQRAIPRLWPQVDYRNLGGTLPGFRDDLRVLVANLARSSASLAARDYSRARREAGIRSTFSVRPAAPPAQEQVDKALGWATRNLYDQSLLAPDVAPEAVQEALDDAVRNVEGVATRLVLNTGRDTTIAAVQADSKATSWARETRPGCCYWCAMLASRGAVYTSARSAGQDHEFHDHDKCVVVPSFGAFEMTAQARQWKADWYDLGRQLGHTPSLNQWRQHFEGRQIDGLPQSIPQLAG